MNPCTALRSCIWVASILPAIDRIQQLRPCAASRFLASGIASPGKMPTPLAPRNVFLFRPPKQGFCLSPTPSHTHFGKRRPARELRNDPPAHPGARKRYCHHYQYFHLNILFPQDLGFLGCFLSSSARAGASSHEPLPGPAKGMRTGTFHALIFPNRCDRHE